MAKSVTTTNCPGCGAVLTLAEIPGKPGRLQGSCGCNKGRPVIEMNVPKVAPKKATPKKKARKGKGEEGNGESVSREELSSDMRRSHQC